MKGLTTASVAVSAVAVAVTNAALILNLLTLRKLLKSKKDPQ